MWALWILGIIGTYLAIGAVLTPLWIKHSLWGHTVKKCHGAECVKAVVQHHHEDSSAYRRGWRAGAAHICEDRSHMPSEEPKASKAQTKYTVTEQCAISDATGMAILWPIGLVMVAMDRMTYKTISTIKVDAERLALLEKEQAVRKAAEDQIIAELRSGNRDLDAFARVLESAPLVQVASKGKR